MPPAGDADTELVLLGWPPDGPTLRLDHRRFSYAGKFVVSNTGKAVVRGEDGVSSSPPVGDAGDAGEDRAYATDVVAAASFNADRTDDRTLWIRYVAVREDYRGEGFGPRLCAFVAKRAAERGYDRVRIAVNNPFAYQALYRAGFAFTGEETGLAELVLERPTDGPADRSTSTYQDGLDRYRQRDLSDDEEAFLKRYRDAEPPDIV